MSFTINYSTTNVVFTDETSSIVIGNTGINITNPNGQTILLGDIITTPAIQPLTIVDSLGSSGTNGQIVSNDNGNIIWIDNLGIGDTGPQGNTGPKGNDGDPGGPQGHTGPKGLDGSNGDNGSTGPQGHTGPKGLDGSNGDNGSTGPQGHTGPKGLDGTIGDNGSTGPQGHTGPKGLDGIGTVGTLAEVLNESPIANQAIDMDGNNFQRVGEIQFLADPVFTPLLSQTGMSVKIQMNGQDYYLQVFSVPP